MREREGGHSQIKKKFMLTLNQQTCGLAAVQVGMMEETLMQRLNEKQPKNMFGYFYLNTTLACRMCIVRVVFRYSSFGWTLDKNCEFCHLSLTFRPFPLQQFNKLWLTFVSVVLYLLQGGEEGMQHIAPQQITAINKVVFSTARQCVSIYRWYSDSELHVNCRLRA